MVKPKLIAAQKTAEGADNTDTELVELHLPDETATLQKILTEIQQPPQDNGAVGVAPGTIQYSDQSRTTEEIVRDILGTVGNGVVHVGRIGYKVKEDYPQYPQKVLRWSADHPYQTAHLVGTAVLMVAPGFLAAPALSAVGFGKTIAGGTPYSILCSNQYANYQQVPPPLCGTLPSVPLHLQVLLQRCRAPVPAVMACPLFMEWSEQEPLQQVA